MLPLLATDAGVRLQLETGIASHRRRFGAWHGGFWLPECAHAPWLDELLEEAGVHVTCVEWPTPGPFRSEAGVVLVALDRTAIDRVWHTSGYPSHGDYRDTHRLTPRAHQAWANDGTPYDPERGAARAREHAREFVDALDGHSVVAFDTELFGHFWHEGPMWLEARARARGRGAGSGRTTASPRPTSPPTSWGAGRDLRTWSAHRTWRGRSAAPSWPRSAPRPSPRALRELLALQSSDWAFLITDGPPATTRASAPPATTTRSRPRSAATAPTSAPQSGSGSGGLGVRPAVTQGPGATLTTIQVSGRVVCSPS